jgi:hypothetical protein
VAINHEDTPPASSCFPLRQPGTPIANGRLAPGATLMSIECHVLLAMVCSDANGDIRRFVRVSDHEGPSALDPLVDHCALHGWLTRGSAGRVRLTSAGMNIVRGWTQARPGQRRTET